MDQLGRRPGESAAPAGRSGRPGGQAKAPLSFRLPRRRPCAEPAGRRRRTGLRRFAERGGLRTGGVVRLHRLGIGCRSGSEDGGRHFRTRRADSRPSVHRGRQGPPACRAGQGRRDCVERGDRRPPGCRDDRRSGPVRGHGAGRGQLDRGAHGGVSRLRVRLVPRQPSSLRRVAGHAALEDPYDRGASPRPRQELQRCPSPRAFRGGSGVGPDGRRAAAAGLRDHPRQLLRPADR